MAYYSRMEAFFFFLGIIFLILIIKFVRDTYITKETEEWWDEYKKTNPEEAAQIERNKGLDLRTHKNQKAKKPLTFEIHADHPSLLEDQREADQRFMDNEARNPANESTKEDKNGQLKPVAPRTDGVYISYVRDRLGPLTNENVDLTMMLVFNDHGRVFRAEESGIIEIDKDHITETIKAVANDEEDRPESSSFECLESGYISFSFDLGGHFNIYQTYFGTSYREHIYLTVGRIKLDDSGKLESSEIVLENQKFTFTPGKL